MFHFINLILVNITLYDIKTATNEQMCWKLIGEVAKDSSGGVKGSVKPIKIPLSHPLASISGPTNAITFTTDLMGDVTMIEKKKKKTETGFALLSDLLDLHAEILQIKSL